MRSTLSRDGTSIKAWATVGLLWLAACSCNVAQLMIVNMHGSIVAAIPMNEAHFGLITSMATWAIGAASLLAGFVADHFSRSRVIAISLLTWSAITCLTAFATTFPQLLAFRALLAVSQACYLPAASALIADYHRGSTRSLASGIHLTGYYAGGVLGGVCGWLAEQHSWQFAYLAVGISGLVCGAIQLLALRDTSRDGFQTATSDNPVPLVRPLAALRSLFAHQSFVLLLVCVTLADALGWTIGGWMPTYMAEHFKLGQGAAGLYGSGCLNGSTFVGLVLGGGLSDWWSARNSRGRFYVPAIGLLFACPCILLAVNTNTLMLAAIGLITTGLTASWFTANVLSMLCLTVDPHFRATGYGLINAAVFFLGGAVIYLTGIWRDLHISLTLIFNIGVIGWVLCVGLLLFIKPMEPAPKAI
jgi:MFS family permease